MIPYLDLRSQYHSIKEEIDSAVLSVLESTAFVLGPEVEAFEREFSAFLGGGHVVAVNSGTSALHLALLALGIGPGDEVITTPFTFVATVAAIIYAGAAPVLVDVDPETLTLDPERIPGAVTQKTKAIVPVHIHGRPAPMTRIMEVARQYDLKVIEDAAQAHGAVVDGRVAGTIGDLGCYSFYPGKNLGAYGEAGAVSTSNPEYARTVRMLRDWGQQGRYNHVLQGFNYRMDAVQAAVLRVKLRHLGRWTLERQQRAATYSELLSGSAAIGLPHPTPGHVYHVYAIRSGEREALQAHLTERGVQTGIHYPYPVHLLPAYRHMADGPGTLPNAELAAREVLSLPLYPELREAQVAEVTEAILGFR